MGASVTNSSTVSLVGGAVPFVFQANAIPGLGVVDGGSGADTLIAGWL